MASEYGWAEKDIAENLYIEDVTYLVKKINKRKLMDWKMQLSIVQNPHVEDPQQLWKLLESQEDRKPEDEKLDRAGFEMLKQKLSKSANIVVKSK